MYEDIDWGEDGECPDCKREPSWDGWELDQKVSDKDRFGEELKKAKEYREYLQREVKEGQITFPPLSPGKKEIETWDWGQLHIKENSDE